MPWSAEDPAPDAHLARFAGVYPGQGREISVSLRDGSLVLDGQLA